MFVPVKLLKQTQQTNWRASNSIFFQFPQPRGCHFPFNFNGTLEMSLGTEPVAYMRWCCCYFFPTQHLFVFEAMQWRHLWPDIGAMCR